MPPAAPERREARREIEPVKEGRPLLWLVGEQRDAEDGEDVVRVLQREERQRERARAQVHALHCGPAAVEEHA